MKIGILSQIIQKVYGETNEQAYTRLKNIGYDAVDYTLEFVDSHAYNPVISGDYGEFVKHYKEVRRALDNSGLEVSQTHAIYPADFDTHDLTMSDATFDYYKRSIEATAILGGEYTVIHPLTRCINRSGDFQKLHDANLAVYRKLVPTLKEFGVKVGVENLFVFNGKHRCLEYTECSDPDALNKYVEELGSDVAAVCLDTGHANLVSYTPGDYARKIGKNLGLLHVHDNFSKDDNHRAPTQGDIDWRDFGAALKEIGYKGVFSLETIYDREFRFDEEVGWKYLEYNYIVSKKIVSNFEE